MHTTLIVSLPGARTEHLSAIEFVFKQKPKNSADALKTVLWEKGNETNAVYTISGDLTKFYIPFSVEDTFLFNAGEPFYADARVHYDDTLDNPTVKLKSIQMEFGLFGEGDSQRG